VIYRSAFLRLNPFSNLLEIGGAKAAAHHGPLRVPSGLG
jgi:hypothetical protein